MHVITSESDIPTMASSADRRNNDARWIDGSFVTEKEAPSDVDVVVFHDPPEVNRLSANRKATLDLLFMDRQVTKLRYHTDAFFIPNDDPDARMYWRGCFGFDHYDNPKGIVRLDLRTP